MHVALTEDVTSYAKFCFKPLSSSEKCEVKVLGLKWNYVHDTFKYSVQDLVILARQLPLTKRSVLKMSARVFNPLGLSTPLSINLKILFQEQGSTEKAHLCLFTCASTRGVHLELVEDYSAEQFLLGFRRFVGRRGLLV